MNQYESVSLPHRAAGATVPISTVPSAFAALGLSPALARWVERVGYTQPTPVQTASIPVILTGKDVLARAETGTGKTAAFALPMIDTLMSRAATPGRARGPRGLVLVPTRELALQVEDAIRRYAGAAGRVRSAAIFGGVSMGGQIQALARGADIVVATPGRLIDHVERRTINLSSVEFLVLDEADRMLDVGFLPALRRLLPALPKKRQTLMFSATLPQAVMSLAQDMTNDPQRVDVSTRAVPLMVTHHVHPVADHRKHDLLARVLTRTRSDQALVFCKTKRGSDRVGRYLEQVGVSSAVIHGNKSQPARRRALDSFRAGRVQVLVATDIAARGLDIPRLPLVVNYDLPLVAEDYIHRIGRTGRAGLAGRAVSLVSQGDRDLLRDIQRLLGTTIEQVVLEGFEDHGVSQQRPASAPPAPSRRPFRSRRQHFAPRGRGGTAPRAGSR